MTAQILSSKLYIPEPKTTLVIRQRLISLINQGMDKKLSLIAAPAGFGKTTLLAEWIDQETIPTAWLSLDANDNDPAQFLSYLAASLQSVGIPLEDHLLAPIKSQLQDDGFQTVLIPLINQAATASQSFTLVLDDYHVIQNPDIHDVVIYLLDHLPPLMHLVIASRADPPIRVAQLRARGELCEIRAEDLRFTFQEAMHFLNKSMGLGLVSPDVETLTAKTEGWIVGLQLAAISLQKNPDKHSFVATFAGDDRYIADYLLDEALRQQPDHINEFLLKTSVLDHLNASLCDTITGRRDSKTILAELENANLFIIPLDNRRQWYRYHHLFADLLRVRLQRRDPEVIPGLHTLASKWHDRNGFQNQAVTHAIQADDIQQLEEIIQGNMLAILEVGEPALLEKQLRSFQSTLEQPNFWICIARAWTLVFSADTKEAQDAVNEAKRLISVSKRDSHQIDKAAGHIGAIRSYIADLSGNTVRSREYAEEALNLLPPDDKLAIAFAYQMIATVYMRKGKFFQAEDALNNALDVCISYPNSYIMLDALRMLSKVQHFQGRLDKAAETLKQAEETAIASKKPGNLLLPNTGFVHIRRSELLYEWNRLDEAWNEISLGLKMIEPWGEIDSFLVGLLQSVQISEAMGMREETFRTIRKAVKLARNLPFWLEFVEVVEAWLHARYGQDEEVDQWLERNRALFTLEPTFQNEFTLRSLVEILIEQAAFKQASLVLERLTPAIETSESDDRRIRLFVLQAVVDYQLGEKDNAVQALTRALDLAQPGGYIRVFLEGGESIAKVLYSCIQQEIQTAYCSKILDEFASSQPAGTSMDVSAQPALVEPLSSRESEVLHLIAEGHTNQEIAGLLHLSLYTVKSHARNIFSKLGVKNRTEAVARARLVGILK